nr:nitronate monooxygenase [Halalkalibacterium halodurans]
MNFLLFKQAWRGGPTTPELVAAVSNHGGLGTIGAGYMTVEVLEVAIKRIRQLTDHRLPSICFVPTGHVIIQD